MFEQILQDQNFIFYILAAELSLLLLLQLRTNHLLRKSLRVRGQKKEKIKQIREEVKQGRSEIPVVKFEKQREKAAEAKQPEAKGTYDATEMAVLQEMMAEFFG